MFATERMAKFSSVFTLVEGALIINAVKSQGRKVGQNPYQVERQSRPPGVALQMQLLLSCPYREVRFLLAVLVLPSLGERRGQFSG